MWACQLRSFLECFSSMFKINVETNMDGPASKMVRVKRVQKKHCHLCRWQEYLSIATQLLSCFVTNFWILLTYTVKKACRIDDACCVISCSVAVYVLFSPSTCFRSDQFPFPSAQLLNVVSNISQKLQIYLSLGTWQISKVLKEAHNAVSIL